MELKKNDFDLRLISNVSIEWQVLLKIPTYKQISCIPKYKNRTHLVSLYTANELKSNAEIYPATAELVGGKSQVRPYLMWILNKRRALYLTTKISFQ